MNRPRGTELDQAIDKVKDALVEMADEERLEVITDLFDGYCRHCGTSVSGRPCYCRNDE